MSCKYKDLTKGDGIHPCCKVTNGECQFLNEPYDSQCHILHAFPRLPGQKYDRKVKCLISTGTQWIDTGIPCNDPTNVIKFKFMPTYFQEVATDNWQEYFGGNSNKNTWNGYIFRNYSDSHYKYHYSYGKLRNASITLDDKTPVEVMYNSSGLYINGVQKLSVGTLEFTGNLYLFASNFNNKPTKNSKMKCYYFSVENKLSLIPVIDFNGKACMFDEINENFFYNKGSGDFQFEELD